MKKLVMFFLMLFMVSAEAGDYVIIGGGASMQPLLNERTAFVLGVGHEVSDNVSLEFDYRDFGELSGLTGKVQVISPTVHRSERATSRSTALGASVLLRTRLDDTEMFLRIGVLRKSVDYLYQMEGQSMQYMYSVGAVPYLGVGSTFHDFTAELTLKQAPHVWLEEDRTTTMFILSYRFH